MQISLTELEVLAGLAEGRTLVDIGDRLAIGHSSVSKALHVVERRLGVPLVERRGRRLRLTAAGIALAEGARDAAQAVAQVEQLAEGLRAGTRGVLRILASATPADYVLPPIIGEFLEVLPEVRVVLRVATLGAMHAELEGGHYDLGVGPPEPIPRGWRGEPLYEDEMLLFVAADSPLSTRRHLSWEEVRAQLLIGQFSEPHPLRGWPAFATVAAGPGRVVELRSAEAIKRLVEASSGIGLLARSAVAQEIRAGRFVPLQVTDLALPMPYALFTRALTRPLLAVARFRALLVERLQPLRPAR